MTMRLLKDIVIPAGTLFHRAPVKTVRCDSGHYEATIGLSKDTSGSLVYFVGDPGDDEYVQLKDWFEET